MSSDVVCFPSLFWFFLFTLGDCVRFTPLPRLQSKARIVVRLFMFLTFTLLFSRVHLLTVNDVFFKTFYGKSCFKNHINLLF